MTPELKTCLGDLVHSWENISLHMFQSSEGEHGMERR